MKKSDFDEENYLDEEDIYNNDEEDYYMLKQMFDNCYNYDDDDGCGEGFSCDECSNYGCPSNPNN